MVLTLDISKGVPLSWGDLTRQQPGMSSISTKVFGVSLGSTSLVELLQLSQQACCLLTCSS